MLSFVRTPAVRRWIVGVAFAATWLNSTEAAACSTCGCGDPTLTSLGTEKPYQGRIRAALTAQVRTDAIGQADVDQVRLRELRHDLNVAWAPWSRLFLQLGAPLLYRDVRTVSSARSQSFGLGDLELRAKPFLFQDREFSPRHLVSGLVGAKIPTAPRQRDANGALLPAEAQPGTGSLDPLLGLAYAGFAAPFSFYASAQVSFPTFTRDELRSSPQLRTTTAAQWQMVKVFATRLGIDTRTDGKAFENGRAERDSGGFIGFLSPELLLSPTPDWLLSLAVRIPVVNALYGYHREGPLLAFTVAYDF